MADMKFDITTTDRQTAATLERVAVLIDKLEKRLDSLDRKRANPKVDLDGAAQTDAQLTNVERKMRDLNGKKATVKVDTDRSLTDTINAFARLGGSLQTLALPASLVAAAPQLAAAGSAALSLSGALGLVPAAGFAAGAGMGAFAIGLAHVADALGPTDTPAQIKKVEKAMAALSPQARALVTELRSMGPEWSKLRLDVQDKLFQSLSSEVDGLGKKYLPLARTQLGGMAVELNRCAVSLTSWAASAPVMADITSILQRSREAAHQLAPAATNVASALTSIGVVGSERLPALANGLTSATDRFRVFIAEARASGQLAEWIDAGVHKVEQLGSIAVNTGGILVSVFSAADRSGADFLGTVDHLTERVDTFLHSVEGQQALLTFFGDVGETLDNLDPGLEAFGRALVGSLTTVAPLLPQAAAGVSEVAQAAGPLVVSAADLARIVLGPLLAGFTAIAPVLTPIAAGLLAITVAGKGMAVAQGFVAGMSARLSEAALNAGVATEKMTGSANAGTAVASAGDKVSGALSRVGSVLPAVGVALALVAWQYDVNRSKADDYAESVVRGSMSVQEAIQKEADTIEHRSALGALFAGTTAAWGNAQESTRIATENLTKSLQAQATNGLDPVMQAQAQAALRQLEYNAAVDRFGVNSPQAQAAQRDYALAVDGVKRSQDDAANATKSATDRMREQQDVALAGANADIAYRQALLDRKSAQEAAARATRDHGAASDEAQRANLALEQADLRVIDAAGRLGQQNSVLTSDQDKARLSVELQRNSILALASSAEGRGSPMLVDMARKMSDTDLAAHNAAVQTSGLHYEVRILPDGRKVNIWTDDAVQASKDVDTLHQRVDVLPTQKKTTIHADGSFSVAGHIGYATGGPIVGPGTSTSDSIVARLSTGEHVMTAREVQAAGGHGAVMAWRQSLVRAPGYATGGPVEMSGTRAYAPDIIPAVDQAIDAGMAKSIADKIKEMMAGLAASVAGALGGGGGAGRWSGLVLQALAMMGQPASYLGITLRRMNQESGGNPRAINLWDSNAKKGTPSIGLMQVIGPTFRSYHDPRTSWDIYDPLANVLSSMRYALARYGSLPAAYNKAGGYANGGIIDSPTFGLVGEAGPEVILPLNRPARSAQLMRQSGLDGGVTIHIDRVEISKEADVDAVLDRLNYLLSGV